MVKVKIKKLNATKDMRGFFFFGCYEGKYLKDQKLLKKIIETKIKV
jgi:hypothetical protein